jgi:hypothetical protein
MAEPRGIRVGWNGLFCVTLYGAMKMEKYGREILWFGGFVAGLASGIVCAIEGDGANAFLSGIMCAFCLCAFADRLRDRTMQRIKRGK